MRHTFCSLLLDWLTKTNTLQQWAASRGLFFSFGVENPKKRPKCVILRASGFVDPPWTRRGVDARPDATRQAPAAWTRIGGSKRCALGDAKRAPRSSRVTFGWADSWGWTLLGAKGIATRSKGLNTRNKKLVETILKLDFN